MNNKRFVLVAGWTLFGIGLAQIPLWACWVIDWKKPILISLREGFQAKPSWGPKNKRKHDAWLMYKKELKVARDEIVKEKYSSGFKELWNVTFGKYLE